MYFLILAYITYRIILFIRFNVKNQIIKARAAAVLKRRNAQYHNFQKEIDGIDVKEVLAMDVT